MLAINESLENTARDALSEMKGLALGAPFMAVAVDALFLGIITCQMTHWAPNAKHDARHVRILIAVAALAAYAGTAYTWTTWMNAFVFNFGTYARFVSVDAMGWYGLLDGCVVVPVQLIFTERAVRINGNSPIIAIVCGVLTIGTAALGFSFLLLTRGASVFSQSMSSIIVSIVWPAVCTTTHVFITSCIIYGLLASRTGSKRADKLLGRLVSVSVESQLPSTVVALVLMTIIASDHKSPFIPFIAIVHPKVFLVGMLAMINLRHEWHIQGKTPSQYESTELGHSRKSALPALTSRGTSQETGTSVATPKLEVDVHYTGRVSHGIDAECGMDRMDDEDYEARVNQGAVFVQHQAYRQ